MILPKCPEVNPIPVMKLLLCGDNVFLYYSTEENRIDGYNERGIIFWGNKMLIFVWYQVKEKR